MREPLVGADNAARVSVSNRLSTWARRQPDWDAITHFLEALWPRQLVHDRPAFPVR